MNLDLHRQHYSFKTDVNQAYWLTVQQVSPKVPLSSHNIIFVCFFVCFANIIEGVGFRDKEFCIMKLFKDPNLLDLLPQSSPLDVLYSASKWWKAESLWPMVQEVLWSRHEDKDIINLCPHSTGQRTVFYFRQKS